MKKYRMIFEIDEETLEDIENIRKTLNFEFNESVIEFLINFYKERSHFWRYVKRGKDSNN